MAPAVASNPCRSVQVADLHRRLQHGEEEGGEEQEPIVQPRSRSAATSAKGFAGGGNTTSAKGLEALEQGSVGEDREGGGKTVKFRGLEVDAPPAARAMSKEEKEQARLNNLYAKVCFEGTRGGKELEGRCREGQGERGQQPVRLINPHSEKCLVVRRGGRGCSGGFLIIS